MTDQNPPPAAQAPNMEQPMPGNPSLTDATAGNPSTVSSTQSYERPAKPPLGARQKSGARLAGIIGFLMFSAGWAMFVFPIVLLLFAALFSFILELVRRANGGGDDEFRYFARLLESVNLGIVIPVLIVIAVIGLVLVIAALFVSVRILRSHGITRAWPVTWAGIGIAIVGSWIVTSVLTVPFSLLSVDFDRGDVGGAIGIVSGVGGFLVTIAATAAVGWLSWWWMAHVMRPAAPAAPADLAAGSGSGTG